MGSIPRVGPLLRVIKELRNPLMSRNARNGKKANHAKIRRRVGEISNEMLKRCSVASMIGEKVKFDKNGKSGGNDAFGANICQSVGENSVVKITR